MRNDWAAVGALLTPTCHNLEIYSTQICPHFVRSIPNICCAPDSKLTILIAPPADYLATVEQSTSMILPPSNGDGNYAWRTTEGQNRTNN